MENSITIRIENFRSLKDVTLDLNDVNLFIGPNNSGKTNVFKALQFLGEWLRTGNVGNFQEVCFGKKTPSISREEYEPLAFSIITDGGQNSYNIYRIEFFSDTTVYQLIGTTYDDSKMKNQEIQIASINYEEFFYSYQIRLSNNEHFFLTNENRDILEQLDKFKQNSDNFLYYKDGSYLKDQNPYSYAKHCFSTYAFLASAIGIQKKIENVFKRIDGFYSIEVDKIRTAAKYEKSVKVAYDASNLVSFIDDMDNNYPTVLDDIKKDFKKCVGNEFSNFKCPVFEDGKAPLRKLKFFDTEGNFYWADEVSDGVLYFLAIVCILHQPEPPQFLLLEEPENGVHPRRIKNIMDYIFDLAEEKNITVIMTSHSPVVLDEFKDVPENVFVFDKNKTSKATEVVNLNDFIEDFDKKATKKGFPVFRRDISLGDNWLTGLINGIPK